MEKEEMLEERISKVKDKFLEQIKDKEIQVVSHFDTDGITSATIMLQTLKKIDKKFSLKILKALNKEEIEKLNPEKITLFLDLASGSLQDIKNSSLSNVFIIDHHLLSGEIPEGIEIINPELFQKQKISGSGLTYLFCKEINPSEKKEMAKLAVLGMIGDQMDKELGKVNHGILEDSEMVKKRGLILYPSTRPLNIALEYSSDPFIPGVTGNPEGAKEFLREIGIKVENKKYPSLIDLTEDQMERLVTGVMLRQPEEGDKSFLGDLFLIKMFGKLEDAREISAKINACSRAGRSDVAVRFCMEDTLAKKQAESIHIKYKQQLLSGIKYAQDSEKITGKGFSILNAKERIKDTMIGTVTSILSNSSLYERGTILIGMSYDNERIKVSARVVGREGRNLKELLSAVMNKFDGDVGGHRFAAGCSISKQDEESFIDELKKHLELEVVRI